MQEMDLSQVEPQQRIFHFRAFSKVKQKVAKAEYEYMLEPMYEYVSQLYMKFK